MNLRQPLQVNKPIENNTRYKIHTSYSDEDFEMFISNSLNVHLIYITYLIDNVLTNDNEYRENMNNANTNSNEQYSYLMKILYQEK